MVIYKCKMCGGNLEIREGSSVATCEYCGSVQTIPSANDEVIINLYNRANALRLRSEFDKAAETYENILNMDNTQSEAHWGLVLCKYGVEYVEDACFGDRVPTCHRTQMESILTDLDYLSAIQYAAEDAKKIYQREAQKINEIQKGILEIVKKEEPFDIFICYKEKDENKERTRDSVIANDIYHELTTAGYKVFYAAITLEDKLGSEYEPYIYAALSTSKIMLVLGTKQEYFNAPWVKNEWSRYLHMMKNNKDRKRMLIPCFKDMDAYDLPVEFSHLQALDMSGIAFMADLTRNIGKIIGKETPSKQVTSNSGGNEVEYKANSLLKRAFIYLDDGDFDNADKALERVLDVNPENARAYIGKLMVFLKVRHETDLMNLDVSFQRNPYYEKALRFADENYRTTIEDYGNYSTINEYEKKYVAASNLFESKSYIEAEKIFRELGSYKDSVECAEKCLDFDIERRYANAINTGNQGNYDDAIEQLSKLNGYKKSEEFAEIFRKNKTESIYRNGVALMHSNKFSEALSEFTEIPGYKDSNKLTSECRNQVVAKERRDKYDSAVLEMERGDLTKAANMFQSLGNYQDSYKRLTLCRKGKRAPTPPAKITLICLAIAAGIAAIIGIIIWIINVVAPWVSANLGGIIIGGIIVLGIAGFIFWVWVNNR